jgi:hypothetical protein
MTAPLDLDELEKLAASVQVKTPDAQKPTREEIFKAIDDKEAFFEAATRAVPQLIARVRELEHLDVGYRKCCAETSAQIVSLEALLAEAERALEAAEEQPHPKHCSWLDSSVDPCDCFKAQVTSTLAKLRAAKGGAG